MMVMTPSAAEAVDSAATSPVSPAGGADELWVPPWLQAANRAAARPAAVSMAQIRLKEASFNTPLFLVGVVHLVDTLSTPLF